MGRDDKLPLQRMLLENKELYKHEAKRMLGCYECFWDCPNNEDLLYQDLYLNFVQMIVDGNKKCKAYKGK